MGKFEGYGIAQATPGQQVRAVGLHPAEFGQIVGRHVLDDDIAIEPATQHVGAVRFELEPVPVDAQKSRHLHVAPGPQPARGVPQIRLIIDIGPQRR